MLMSHKITLNPYNQQATYFAKAAGIARFATNNRYLVTLSPTPYESIPWLKSACLTAYSYPYDDHSGSFYCYKNAAGSFVQMDYEVVFCPGGVTGGRT